jgi:hypothetical protein
MNSPAQHVLKYAKLVHEVIQYSLLEAGWDGEYSVPPPAESIKLAIDFIRLIPIDIPFPTSMVSFSGLVGFYWDSPTAYADVEVDHAGEFSIYSVVKKSDPKQDSWLPRLKLASFTPDFFIQHLSPLKEDHDHLP